MGFFDALLQGTGVGSGTGPLSRLTGSGGILSTDILSTRLATIKAAPSPMEKVTAAVGTLGMRFKAPPGGAGGTSTQAFQAPMYQAGAPMYQSSIARAGTVTQPPVISTPPVQFG